MPNSPVRKDMPFQKQRMLNLSFTRLYPRSSWIRSALLVGALFVLIAGTFSFLSSSPIRVQNLPRNQKFAIRATRELATSTVHVIDGVVFNFNISVRSYEELNNFYGNTGDILWRTSAVKSIADFSKGNVHLCGADLAPEVCLSSIPKELNELPVIVHFGSANILQNNEIKRIQRLQWYAEQKRVERVIVIAIGAQMNFKSTWNVSELRRSTWTDASAIYPLSSELNSSLRVLNKHDVEFITRGDFTARVAKRAGLMKPKSIGCPSLMINTDPFHGRILADRYAKLHDRIGDNSLKVAVTLTSFPKRPDNLWHTIVRGISQRYPNALFYVQTKWDVLHLQECGVSFNRTRYYNSLPDWLEGLKDREVSFGPRIHGGMASIAAGIPTVVMAPDYRVLELVKKMRIPYITHLDVVHQNGSADLARLAAYAGFSGSTFDQHRWETAKFYRSLFTSMNIPLYHHIHLMADMATGLSTDFDK